MAGKRVPKTAWLDAATVWLAAALDAQRAPQPLPHHPALELIVRRFALDEQERAIVTLLAALETAFTAWPRVIALGGCTVRTIGGLLGDIGATIERLQPSSRLRRHAIVHVDGAHGRLAGASDTLCLEVGIVPTQRHLAASLVRYEPGGQRDEDLAQRLTSKVPQVVRLERAPQAEHAQAIANALQRPVIVGSIASASAVDIARLRRDADLEGAVLWVHGATLELFVAPPVGEPVALILIGDDSIAPPAPWRVRRDKTDAQPAARNELDYIRELAQRDADRALGIVRTGPTAPPRVTVPGRVVESSVRVAETPAVEIIAAPEPQIQPEAKPEVIAAKAEVIAAAPERQPEPVISATPSPPQPSAPDGERIELPPDASLDHRARASMHSPSATQRIELLESFAGHRTPACIAALRHNVRSEHAALRAVAERIMTQIFGPNWNRSRAIAPPVQPPVSEE